MKQDLLLIRSVSLLFRRTTVRRLMLFAYTLSFLNCQMKLNKNVLLFFGICGKCPWYNSNNKKSYSGAADGFDRASSFVHSFARFEYWLEDQKQNWTQFMNKSPLFFAAFRLFYNL